MSESRISGHATAEGTLHFSNRFPELSEEFNQLGGTGLLCSPVGFGTYRCDVRIAEHRAALGKAIRMGVNLIDTSANYADGNAERLIGEVVKALIDAGEIERNEIIIVSKGGYIQGDNYERISKLVTSES